MMSQAEWYYVKDDRQNGPVAFENLVELIRSGVLTGESYVLSLIHISEPTRPY